ncbi:P-II family nitrogen regulator [Desulfovibrio legallii]|jgi:nitrogen regulatory protein PII 2|uniref:Nitrogen regulatory protein P-II family n=1 Tax=Desulfovibrio legallii TaxID=571438 RepID=A0A1G7I6S9_9BACT|nr:P-II family nitrogen regulator [Desulfovibrio legallii]SDF08164.1 nitrogen regulatory protein P-II family [Desulfovibrio legallii]
MKEVIAIIRPNKVTATRKALDRLGFPCMSAVAVLGRGKQRGIADEVAVQISPIVRGLGSFKGMPYVPKRLLSIVVPDAMTDKVVDTIIKVNQTGDIGDGKLIVCPVEDALRVRTGETGEAAIA